MKIGAQTTGWTPEWSNESLDVLHSVKEMGFDFVEIPFTNLDRFDSVTVGKRLQEIKLQACTSTLLLREEWDITSTDRSVRQNGVRYLKQCVDAAASIGATLFSGVIYTHFGKKPDRRPTADDWNYSAECLREVAVYAQNDGVTIGLEPINRYETYLINTCEQALALIDQIQEPNVGVHLDTYHMNMEEKNIYEAVMKAGSKLVHIHTNENDWGIPGSGHFEWDSLFLALSELKYSGYAAIESTVHLQGNPVWRQLAPSGTVLMSEGGRFLRQMRDKYIK